MTQIGQKTYQNDCNSAAELFTDAFIKICDKHALVRTIMMKDEALHGSQMAIWPTEINGNTTVVTEIETPPHKINSRHNT